MTRCPKCTGTTGYTFVASTPASGPRGVCLDCGASVSVVSDEPEQLEALSLEDRAMIRRMLARRAHTPELRRFPLRGGEGLAARYELALTELEQKYELLAIANGAKAVALEELRERVAGGW